MWDEKYDGAEYIYGTEPNTVLHDNFTAMPLGKVLCLAEGEGRNAVFLARQGYKVTAVDSSIIGLKKAEKLADENDCTIEIVHADLEDFDPGLKKWDGIVSIFCHIPLHIRKKLHKKIVHALKTNGVFLLEAYTAAQLAHGTGGPPTEDLMMSAELLREELNGLEFKQLQELERDVIEGSYHSGRGAVVQAIGRLG